MPSFRVRPSPLPPHLPQMLFGIAEVCRAAVTCHTLSIEDAETSQDAGRGSSRVYALQYPLSCSASFAVPTFLFKNKSNSHHQIRMPRSLLLYAVPE